MFKTSAYFLASMAKASPFLFCSHNQISLLNLCLLSTMFETGESQNQKQSRD